MTQTGLNFWENCKTEGKDFLSYLRDSSHARNLCRQIISELIVKREISSLLEVGVGGLNEYLALKDVYAKSPGFRFTGTDWTTQFIEEAKARFPAERWEQLDITQCKLEDSLRSDIVYSQHVLEHCPGLNPPLSNMLQLANKLFLNIFFMPPALNETIDFNYYPLYHNVYSLHHIIKVCDYHGFIADFRSFSNQDMPGANECQNEVVLVAMRRESK